jgi:hypothetical protein
MIAMTVAVIVVAAVMVVGIRIVRGSTIIYIVISGLRI